MSPAALALDGVDAGFPGRPVLHDVSLSVETGEIVAILGLNGAGKSVLGRTISGLVRVTKGRVLLHGDDVTTSSPGARVRRGLHHLSQRRGLVPELTVAENVRVAAFGAARRVTPADIDAALPLARWHAQRAGELSGGEQALVALARAELLTPSVLVADEPTAGLAPAAVDAHATMMRALANRGTGVVLIEQNLSFTLHVADRIAVLRTGSLVLDTPRPQASEAVVAEALVGSVTPGDG